MERRAKFTSHFSKLRLAGQSYNNPKNIKTPGNMFIVGAKSDKLRLGAMTFYYVYILRSEKNRDIFILALLKTLMLA